MERQILVSLLVIGGAAGAIGAGTFAFFTDDGSSADNIFTATTLDLHLNGDENVVATLGSTGFLPGKVTDGMITLRNAGNSPDNEVDVDLAFEVIGTDALGATTDMAKYLEVTSLMFGTQNLLDASETCWGAGALNGNGNEWVDLDDLATRVCADLNSPGAGRDLSIEVTFRTEAGNALQGDSVDLKLNFQLAQIGAPDLTA